MTAPPKKIDDLPHFRVSAVKPNEKSSEYFELIGVFDNITHVAEGRCSLLLPFADELSALPGYVEFQNQEEGTARVYTPSEKQPDVAGRSLTYVPPNWNPLHVWMVALPTWKWTKALFQRSDAISEIVKGTDVSIIDGEEVREWIKVSEKGKNTGLSRYYPIFPSGKSSLLQIEADGTIVGGWNHAHCLLCKTHIESGHYWYVDPNENWVCQQCYAKHVVEHDLSFMFG